MLNNARIVNNDHVPVIENANLVEMGRTTLNVDRLSATEIDDDSSESGDEPLEEFTNLIKMVTAMTNMQNNPRRVNNHFPTVEIDDGSEESEEISNMMKAVTVMRNMQNNPRRVNTDYPLAFEIDDDSSESDDELEEKVANLVENAEVQPITNNYVSTMGHSWT
jgi:hypothetical protein